MDFRKGLGLFIIFVGLVALLSNLYGGSVNFSFLISLLMIIVGGLCLYNYFKKYRSLTLFLLGVILFFWGSGIFTYEAELVPFHLKNHFLLFGIGCGFLAVFFNNIKNWWAIIPGGTILVFLFVDLLGEIFDLNRGVPTFLVIIGIGLIFFYLYLIRDEQNRLGWAVYPAITLILFSLIQLYFSTRQTSVQIAIAVSLIGIGFLLIIRPFKSANSSVSGQAVAPTDSDSQKPVPANPPDRQTESNENRNEQAE